MRYSLDPVILNFLKIYDETPKADRKQIPLELIAVKAGCDFPALIGSYVLTLRNLQAQKSAIRAMVAHPAVVSSTVKFALQEDGDKDRKMLHEAVGFLPTPKGLTITLPILARQPDMPEAEKPAAGEVELAPDVNEVFSLVKDRQENWQEQRKKLLSGDKN